MRFRNVRRLGGDLIKTEFSGEIRVKWYGGYMIIDRGLAFPATADWLKKYLKIVRLDWEHEAEILEDLAEYLEYNVGRCEAEAKISNDKGEVKRLRSNGKRYASNLKMVRKRLEAIR